MPTKGEIFVQEFVLGFGFLGGLFAWVGVDPEEEILKGLLRAFFPNNESMISIVLVLFVLLSVFISILGTLAVGGKLGLLAVALAWISGFTMPLGNSWTVVGAAFLIAALIIGPLACEQKS